MAMSITITIDLVIFDIQTPGFASMYMEKKNAYMVPRKLKTDMEKMTIKQNKKRTQVAALHFHYLPRLNSDKVDDAKIRGMDEKIRGMDENY